MIRKSEKVYLKTKVTPSHRARMKNNVELNVIINNYKIGSAFKAGTNEVLRGLSFEEEKKLLPEIIGTTPDSDKWTKATKEYWMNITKTVPNDEKGLELEVGFKYENADKANQGQKELETEIARKLEATKTGEKFTERFTQRIKVGTPINISDFILYRYCLVYSRVANNPDDMNRSVNIRFFLYSEQRQNLEKTTKLKSRKVAYEKYLEISGNSTTVNNLIAVLQEVIQVHNNNPTNVDKRIVTGTQVQNDIALERIVTTYPAKFLIVANDDKLKMKAFIEHCISKGELKRLPNTDTIIYGDNTKLGSTVNESIVYLEDEKNREVLQTLKARMKTLKQ